MAKVFPKLPLYPETTNQKFGYAYFSFTSYNKNTTFLLEITQLLPKKKISSERRWPSSQSPTNLFTYVT